MAAPAEKTLTSLSGRWTMNRGLSDRLEPALNLQGINIFIIKALNLTTVTSHINQYTETSENGEVVITMDITQSAAKLAGTKEHHCLDGLTHNHRDWIFGEIQGYGCWLKLTELEDEYLKSGWIEESKEDKFIVEYTENHTSRWAVHHIWGFQMIEEERRFCRKAFVEKDGRRINFRIVYDYID